MTDQEARKYFLRFLLAYKQWIDEGAPENQVFLRGCGLCSNIWEWARSAKLNDPLQKLLEQLLEKDGLDTTMPFNPIDGDYYKKSWQRVHHENPARLRWVKKTIQELSQ